MATFLSQITFTCQKFKKFKVKSIVKQIGKLLFTSYLCQNQTNFYESNKSYIMRNAKSMTLMNYKIYYKLQLQQHELKENCR